MPDNLTVPKLLVAGAALLLGISSMRAESRAADLAAQTPTPVLVELFTSEGCSSCPPADRLLADLDHQQPVPAATIIVLSEHVDYWDHLGWRDPYSSYRWSERQNQYGRRFGLDSVYTPQMVIDGVHQVNGSDASAVRHAIEQSATRSKLTIGVGHVAKTNDMLDLTLSVEATPASTLYAAIADDRDRSSVERGENQGRTLEHVAVVRSLTELAELQKPLVDKTFAIHLPPADPAKHLRLVIFAQDKNGRIVGVIAQEL
jgi:hypothetical protein